MLFRPQESAGAPVYHLLDVPADTSTQLIYGCKLLHFIASPSVQSAPAKFVIFCNLQCPSASEEYASL